MTRKAIPKQVRQQVYDKCNGHCAYCGCKLDIKDMQVDHIESVYRAEYNGKRALEDVRRWIILDLVDGKRKVRNIPPKEKDNSYLAEL